VEPYITNEHANRSQVSPASATIRGRQAILSWDSLPPHSRERSPRLQRHAVSRLTFRTGDPAPDTHRGTFAVVPNGYPSDFNLAFQKIASGMCRLTIGTPTPSGSVAGWAPFNIPHDRSGMPDRVKPCIDQPLNRCRRAAAMGGNIITKFGRVSPNSRDDMRASIPGTPRLRAACERKAHHRVGANNLGSLLPCARDRTRLLVWIERAFPKPAHPG